MKIDADMGIRVVENSSAGALLRRLEVGDFTSAMVMDVSHNEALLRFSDGSVVKAATAAPFNFKPGQYVELAVISREEGILYLKTAGSSPKPENTAAGNTAGMAGKLEKLLEMLGLNPEGKYMELAAELFKAGMRVSRANLGEALTIMKSIDSIDAGKAVFLLASAHEAGISASDLVAGIKKLEIDPRLPSNLIEGNVKLGQLLGKLNEAISRLSGKTPEVPGGLIINGGTGAANTSQAGHARNSPDGTATAGSGSPADGSIASAAVNRFGTAVVNGRTIADRGIMNGTAANGLSEGAVTAGGAGHGIKVPGGANGASRRDFTYITPVSGQNGKSASASGAKQLHAIGEPAVLPGNEAGSMTEPDDLKSREISAGTVDGGKVAAANAGMAALFGGSGIHETEPGDHIIKWHLFHILSDKDINIIQASSRSNGEKTPETLEATIAALRRSSVSLAAAGEGWNNTLADIFAAPVDAIKLLNYLNSAGIPYFQVPVSITGYDTTAEIYIMKRRKGGKKGIDPKNTAMFISLDTKNIGRIETILDITGKTIIMSLRTEKQRICDFFRENMDFLRESLANYGYKLADVKYSVFGLGTPPSKQGRLVSETLETALSGGGFDIRI